MYYGMDVSPAWHVSIVTDPFLTQKQLYRFSVDSSLLHFSNMKFFDPIDTLHVRFDTKPFNVLGIPNARFL